MTALGVRAALSPRRVPPGARRLAGQWGALLTGNVGGSLLHFLGVVVTVRAIGLDAFGSVALIAAYVAIVDGLLNFQSVHVLTKHLGGRDIGSGRSAGLIKLGVLTDLGTAALALAVAALCAPLAVAAFSLDTRWLPWMLAATLLIPTRLLGTPEAVLRCAGRFDVIGWRSGLVGGGFFLGALVAWRAGAPPPAFLVAWLGGEALANLVLIGGAARVLGRRGCVRVRRARARDALRDAPFFWSSLFHTNLMSTLRLLTQDADILLVGGLLGPAAAGGLRSVKSVSRLMSSMGVEQVLSPRIAARCQAGDSAGARRVFGQGALAVGGAFTVIAAVLAVLGGRLLGALYGPEAAALGALLALMAGARALNAVGAVSVPLLVSTHRSGALAVSAAAGALVFFAATPPLLLTAGLLGVGVGQVLAEATSLALRLRRAAR